MTDPVLAARTLFLTKPRLTALPGFRPTSLTVGWRQPFPSLSPRKRYGINGLPVAKGYRASLIQKQGVYVA